MEDEEARYKELWNKILHPYPQCLVYKDMVAEGYSNCSSHARQDLKKKFRCKECPFYTESYGDETY